MKTTTVCSLLFVVLCGASAALAVPTYSIVPLGFDDSEHTRNDGYKYSSAVGLNEAGQVAGYSSRFNGSRRDLGLSAWLYGGGTTINIGLIGAEHTRIDGYKYSRADLLNEAGQGSGTSQRYNGGSTDLGDSAWLYDGATTLDISLTGAEHTRSDGYKASYAGQLNEAGQVSGTSQRYNGGSTDLGYSAWLYDGATTLDISLTGAEHTRSDGYKASYAGQLNEAGQVSGSSERYNGGSTDLGRSAWLYDGATTLDISLTGAEHTRSDGYRNSGTARLNQAGQVIGSSNRYNGDGADFGISAWLYDGATTLDVGLTGTEHTRNDGYKASYLATSIQFTYGLNEAGQVIGGSKRYHGGSAELGDSAWLYDGGATIDIGLTGAEHTRNDGYKSSYANLLNEAGQVSGGSDRYSGGSEFLGYSAWLYDGGATIHIGLTGAEHTRSDGYRNSVTMQMNDAGHVSGFSLRFDGGGTDPGQSAWLYDGGATLDIGLTGPEHTRNDGFKYSFTDNQLNKVGQVAGYSVRFNGSTNLGADAWLYDPTLAQTFSLQLSTRSDGYANSAVYYLGDDGLVLGVYTLYDALDNDLGLRAFHFTVADGLHDLGSLVDGGLSANGWDYLAEAVRANGLGQIIGQGKLTSQSGGSFPYLLTPVVPEPSTLLLALCGTLGLRMRRRR